MPSRSDGPDAALVDYEQWSERSGGPRDVLDRQYVVRDGEIVIVDESRPAGRGRNGGPDPPGGRGQGGRQSHVRHGQAAASRAGFLPSLRSPAGMTGTAAPAPASCARSTNAASSRCHQPPAHRQQLPTLVFGTARRKVAGDHRRPGSQHAAGRPVLIGTRSIDKSEHLSQLLTVRGIEHTLLNARHVPKRRRLSPRRPERQGDRRHEHGRPWHRHSPRRRGRELAACTLSAPNCTRPAIDRQLIGRCGRQGDPGTYRHSSPWTTKSC